MNVRIDTNIKRAIDLHANEVSIKENRHLTFEDALWDLLQKGAPDLAQRVRDLAPERFKSQHVNTDKS